MEQRPSGQVFGTQPVLTHGGDDLNDGFLSLGKPLLTLIAALSDLPALVFAIVHLGEGRPQFAHQLLKALITHGHMWPGAVELDGVSVAQLLVCERHRSGYFEIPTFC